MQKKAKRLILAIIFALFAFFSGGVISTSNENALFKTGVQTVKAEIIEATKTSRWRHFHKTVRYHFTYVFSVQGKVIKDTFETGEDGGKIYIDTPEVDVVYKIDDPSKHRLKSAIGEVKTLSGMAWSLTKAFIWSLILGYFLGYIIASKLGWIQDDDEDTDKPSEGDAPKNDEDFPATVLLEPKPGQPRQE